MIAYRSSAVTQHGAHSINHSRRSSLMTGARWLAASAWLLSPLTICHSALRGSPWYLRPLPVTPIEYVISIAVVTLMALLVVVGSFLVPARAGGSSWC